VYNPATWENASIVTPDKPAASGYAAKFTAELPGLQTNVKYVYAIGLDDVWSHVYSFTIKSNGSRDLSFVVMGGVADNEPSNAVVSQVQSQNMLAPITTIFSYKPESTHPGMAALQASVPNLKVPDDQEQDFSFEYAGIYFIFLNTYNYTKASEKWLETELISAGEMKWVLVFGSHPAAEVSYEEQTVAFTDMLDINSASAYISLGGAYERNGVSEQKETFYITVPDLGTTEEYDTFSVEEPDHVVYGPRSFGVITLGKDKQFIRWSQQSLETHKEDDTFFIPKRTGVISEDEISSDIKFGVGVSGVLVGVIIIALFMKCANKKSDEVTVSYEMQKLREGEAVPTAD
jgi:hypothetical protein